MLWKRHRNSTKTIKTYKAMAICEAHCKDVTIKCEDPSDDCSCNKYSECQQKCRKDPAMVDWKGDPHVCAKKETEKVAELRYDNECMAKCVGEKSIISLCIAWPFYFVSGYSDKELCYGGCPCKLDTHMTEAKCKTEGGEDCIFPFKANEKIYEKCTDDYNNEIKASDKQQPWCAIKVDKQNRMLKWDFCMNYDAQHSSSYPQTCLTGKRKCS